MNISGIHHATMVSSNAQRTVDFYTQVLGFRLVKQTVNFEQPDTSHLYFGDEAGSPGSLLTFFVWPGSRRGIEGIGGTHHIALTTENRETQLRWKRWLIDHEVTVRGPYDRVYFTSIYFSDPDGVILEIATRGPGFTVDEPADRLGHEVKKPGWQLMAGWRDEEAIDAETWLEPVQMIDPEMSLRPIHHITAIGTKEERTLQFLNEVVGLRTLKRTVNFDNPQIPHLYVGSEDGSPGGIITYFAYAHGEYRPFRMGTGVTHHYALAIADDAELETWRDYLASRDIDSSNIRDRKYFKSLYFHDPDGQIIELATRGPGFLIDEDVESLGTRLQLPEALEPRRDEIASKLAPLSVYS